MLLLKICFALTRKHLQRYCIFLNFSPIFVKLFCLFGSFTLVMLVSSRTFPECIFSIQCFQCFILFLGWYFSSCSAVLFLFTNFCRTKVNEVKFILGAILRTGLASTKMKYQKKKEKYFDQTDNSSSVLFEDVVTQYQLFIVMQSH